MATYVSRKCDICEEVIPPGTAEQITIGVRCLDVCDDCIPKTTVKELMDKARPQTDETAG